MTAICNKSWRTLQVLMLLALCSQSLVLEYFGGNPDLSIDSYARVAKNHREPVEQISVRGPEDEQSGDCEGIIDADDCFISCTHTLAEPAVLVEPDPEPVISVNALPLAIIPHINADKDRLFHPPKLT